MAPYYQRGLKHIVFRTLSLTVQELGGCALPLPFLNTFLLFMLFSQLKRRTQKECTKRI